MPTLLLLPLFWEGGTELMASNSNTPTRTLMLYHLHAAPSILLAQAPFLKTPHTEHRLTHRPSDVGLPQVHPSRAQTRVTPAAGQVQVEGVLQQPTKRKRNGGVGYKRGSARHEPFS